MDRQRGGERAGCAAADEAQVAVGVDPGDDAVTAVTDGGDDRAGAARCADALRGGCLAGVTDPRDVRGLLVRPREDGPAVVGLCARRRDAVGAGDRVQRRELPARRAEAVEQAARAGAAAGGMEGDQRRPVVADADGGLVDPPDGAGCDHRRLGEVVVGLADHRGQQRAAVAQRDRAGPVARRGGGRGAQRGGGVREGVDVAGQRARRGPGERHDVGCLAGDAALAQQQRRVERPALVDGEGVAGRVTGDGEHLRRGVRVDRSGRGPGTRGGSRGAGGDECSEEQRPDPGGDASGEARHVPYIGSPRSS